MRAGTVIAIAGVVGVAWWIWSRRQPSQSAGEALASAVAGPVQAAAGLAQGAWGLITGATSSDDADAADVHTVTKPPERLPDKYGNR